MIISFFSINFTNKFDEMPSFNLKIIIRLKSKNVFIMDHNSIVENISVEILSKLILHNSKQPSHFFNVNSFIFHIILQNCLLELFSWLQFLVKLLHLFLLFFYYTIQKRVPSRNKWKMYHLQLKKSYH